MYSKHKIDEEAEKEARALRVMRFHDIKPRKNHRREYVKLSSDELFDKLLNQELENER